MKNLIQVPSDTIISRIFYIRGKKVMFDSDLAKLYEVETKNLNKAVNRNKDRFPSDFCFRLNDLEASNLRSQLVTSSSRFQSGTLKRGGNMKYLPRVFTEEGVAMLSSVLKSKKAIQVNIQIIRKFKKLREILSENKKLAEKIEKMEAKYDSEIANIFEVIRSLINEKEKPKVEMGFRME
ncbi:MAG: ORF6N domain-containing protein [Candidatus Paceibacterota bacterium]